MNLRKDMKKYWKKIPVKWRPFFTMVIILSALAAVTLALPTGSKPSSAIFTRNKTWDFEKVFFHNIILYEKPWDKIEKPWEKIRVKVYPQPYYSHLEQLCYEIYKYNVTNSSYGNWFCVPTDRDNCLCVSSTN